MASSIEDAIRNARYNEAVVVSVEGNNEESREIVLIASLDKHNGGVSWQDASADSHPDGFDVGILRHFRTKRWIVPMLNDIHRNNLYENSIRKACNDVKKRLQVGKSEVNILDIGTGTGLLAMMAGREMNEQGLNSRITSVEMASAMARLAKMTIAENKMEDQVEIVESHSCDPLFDPFSSNKAMLCTSELLETSLLAEGIIPAMRDAWERHLDKNAIVVPQKARVYAQVIESETLIHSHCGPHLSEHTVISLSPTRDGKPLLSGGVRIPVHAGIFGDSDSEFLLNQFPTDSSDPDIPKFLSKTFQVFEFDFSAPEKLPPKTGGSNKITLEATGTGIPHGVLFWWELDLYNDETYSTELGKSPWQDHWQQCVYAFGQDCKNVKLEKGSPFELTAYHDDTSIDFEITKSSENPVHLHKRKKLSNEAKIENSSKENHISYERALQLNDENRLTAFTNSIGYAIKQKGQDSILLDISDFSICAIIAASTFGAKNVSTLESFSHELCMLSAAVCQEGNNLPKEGASFSVIHAYAENITPNEVGGEVDIICAEPYYQLLEGWHLQEALNYFYTLKNMKKRGVVKNNAISIPDTATIMICAAQFDNDIIKAHSSIHQSMLKGFHHDTVKKYADRFHTFDNKIYAGQYKWKRLSDNIPVAKIQYNGTAEDMKIDGDDQWKSFEINVEGEINGLLLWVDYAVKTSDNEHSTITTGNHYHQQACRFLSSPRKVESSSSVVAKVKITFDTQTFESHVIDFELV